MEQSRILKQAAQTIEELTGKIKALHSRCEDIQIRAMRIESWLKNQANPRAIPPDRAFPDDLKLLRRDMKRLIQEFMYLPGALGKIARAAVPEPEAVEACVKMNRSASLFQQVVLSLLSPVQIAHQHIRIAECKIDAWFIAQELEAWAKETVSIPLACNKILLKISPPPEKSRGGEAPPAPGPGPAAAEGGAPEGPAAPPAGDSKPPQ